MAVFGSGQKVELLRLHSPNVSFAPATAIVASVWNLKATCALIFWTNMQEIVIEKRLLRLMSHACCILYSPQKLLCKIELNNAWKSDSQ